MYTPRAKELSRIKSLRGLYRNSQRWIQFGFYGYRQKRSTPGKWDRVSGTGTDCVLGYCMSGALDAFYKGKEREKARDRLTTAIQKYTKGKVVSIIGFNDRRSTTIEDVRKVCRLAKV